MSGQAEESAPESQDNASVTFWTILRSTLAAAFGVQSRRNRERDFNHGRPGAFIAAGLVFTLLFVGVLIAVVMLVIRAAAG